MDKNSPSQLELTTPFNLIFQNLVDFRNLRYGGSAKGVFEGEIYIPQGDGCLATDYQLPTDISPTWISVVQYPATASCSTITKAMVAEAAGAAALIFYNQPTSKSLPNGRVRGSDWYPGEPLATIPVLTASYSVGVSLAQMVAQNQKPTLKVTTDLSIDIVETINVFCDTKHGNADDVIVIGSHLDSVPDGPGINDNGSGSATVLEICLQFHKNNFKSHNRVQFAWWGAEEIGLLGSRHFVRNLSSYEDEWKKIVANLNFDMVSFKLSQQSKEINNQKKLIIKRN